MKLFSTSHFILFSSHVSQHSRTLGVKRGWRLEHEIPLYLEPSDAREWACLNMLDLGVLGFYFKAWGSSNQHLRIEYLIFNLKVYFLKWYLCILLGMYIVAFSIGFLFWKSCKSWRRLGALDYIWKSGVGFTLFYFTDLFVEILGRKGSGTMIFIVSWCYGGLAMVVFIGFWQGSYPPWWHHTGIHRVTTLMEGRLWAGKLEGCYKAMLLNRMYIILEWNEGCNTLLLTLLCFLMCKQSWTHSTQVKVGHLLLALLYSNFPLAMTGRRRSYTSRQRISSICLLCVLSTKPLPATCRVDQ